jgi:hypothetical protein
MVAYNFKKRFVPLLETGAKQQTIRSPRKRHTKPGEAMQLYTGMRTKACRKLVTPDPICISVEPLLMHDALGIKLSDRWLPREALIQLAIADGFADWDECLRFFSDVHGLPFQGVLIKWRVVGGCHLAGAISKPMATQEPSTHLEISLELTKSDSSNSIGDHFPIL